MFSISESGFRMSCFSRILTAPPNVLSVSKGVLIVVVLKSFILVVGFGECESLKLEPDCRYVGL